MSALKLCSGALLVLALGVSLLRAAPGAARPPNVVVLLADDQGWADLGVNGNTNARTPNLDALARSGAIFDRFYVCPVCSPTRAEFLTGRYYPRTGVTGVDSGLERLNADERTMGDTFKAAGYATAMFGKWHNGGQGPYHPNARGFDEFYGFIGGHWGWYFDAPMEHNGQDVRGHGYIADDLVDHALTFLTKNREQPFFCYLAFNTPHSPFCVPDAYWDRWKDAPLALRSPDAARENLATTRCVMAMNENLDWNIGRLLQHLEQLGLTEDTIVVYFSDNGANTPRWNGGMKGRKTSTDEGGVRAPCFIRWPRHIPAGTTVRELAGAIDLHPTLARLAGVSPVGSRQLDGVDVTPLLRGQTDGWPQRMIFSHWAGRSSVRTQRYRLDDHGALFDMLADPGQQADIRAIEPEVAARLSGAIAEWRRSMFGDAGPAAARPAGVQRAVVVDPRPIPVGHRVHPATMLPAGEGLPAGGVRRSNRFPNCTFFTNWTSRDDSMTWEIEVVTAGRYEAVLDYSCPEPGGSTVELRFREERLAAKIAPAWDPPLRETEDRVPRQESYLKEFRPLALGTMQLDRGRGQLILRATAIPGKQVGDIHRVTLRLISPK